MSAKIVECVPNFSEGRRPEIIEQVVDQVRETAGAILLDYSSDADHNRTVVTYIGTPEACAEAAFKLTAKAAELIDMNVHEGGHPRMGATDVIPFIPISGVKLKDCIEIANEVGERIAKELNIPIYLYERAAKTDKRKNLSVVRKGEYEGFKDKINDPEWAPDFGESKLHPTAGATVVGARPALVAFNVNLDTSDVEIANKIAKKVRESNGGLKNVKGMGVMLEDRNIAQVSMNMTNYKKTALYRSFEMIKMEAKRYGVNVVGSEIVGLVPMDALIDCAGYYLQLEGFSKKNQILERRLQG